MTPYPLHRSDRQTKVLITLFLISTLAAFTVAELNVYDKVGRIKNGPALRYGPDREPPAAENAATPDPNAEPLPLETDALIARINTFSALLDVTHPHVFEMPLVILVLAHFLMRTRLPAWFKLTNYATSFGGMTLFLSAPWLVRYVTLRAAPALYAGAVGMGLSVLLMIITTTWDLWTPRELHSNRGRDISAS
ncbi:MAG TPA: hypothetical protein VJ302_08580 [Blastocatellia bacterium]|nr:hypothetical protein [Blastocatellia bacterium]